MVSISPLSMPVAAAAVTPPAGQPPLVDPGSPLGGVLTAAAGEIGQSINALQSVPQDQASDPQFKHIRKAAFDANKRAQELLAQGFNDPNSPQTVVKVLRDADANLELANWKTVGKDPRTNQPVGPDPRGAIEHTVAAAGLVQGLIAAPPAPPTTPPGGPWTPPSPLPPGTPPAPTPVPTPVPGNPWTPGQPLPKPEPLPVPAPDSPVGTSIGVARKHAVETLELLAQVSVDKPDAPEFTELRRSAFSSNSAAQEELQKHFGDSSLPYVLVDHLQSIKNSLKHANQGIIGASGATGAFVRIDIPTAIVDTKRAVELLAKVMPGGTPTPAPAPAPAPAPTPAPAPAPAPTPAPPAGPDPDYPDPGADEQ